VFPHGEVEETLFDALVDSVEFVEEFGALEFSQEERLDAELNQERIEALELHQVFVFVRLGLFHVALVLLSQFQLFVDWFECRVGSLIEHFEVF